MNTVDPLRLLLVDDDREDAFLFQRHLRKVATDRPFHLSHASSHDDALALLGKESFDLCFFDYNLGKKSGLELFETFRVLDGHTPVIFLTGFGDEETAVSLMKSGAVDYLKKERLSPENLGRSIHMALEIATSERGRRKAEAALVENRVYLDNILRSATDMGIIATDGQLRIKYLNPRAEEILAITRSDIIGQSVYHIHERLGIATDRLETGLRRIAERGEHLFAMTLDKEDGPHFYDARASGILDAGQQIVGYCLTVRDVTERRHILQSLEEAVQEAENANRAKSEFLAVMSHEIRTPMNAILGMAELALEDERVTTQRHRLDIIATAGESLLTIINDILDFSKIEAGQLYLEDTDFHLPQVVAQVAQMFAEPAAAKGVTLIWEVAVGVPEMVRGDHFRLRQILVNLLSNAVKFTETGRVTLRAAATDVADQVLFSVQDTGIGVVPDRLEKLFQPFTQADTSTSRRYGGTGLGLSISRRLAQCMGGKLWAQSAPGQGSTFSVLIPFARAQGMPLATPRGNEPAQETAPAQEILIPEGLRLLVVEDDPVNCEVLLGMLKRIGARPDVAVNGEEALARLTGCEIPYQLVLLDCQMPVLDGFEVCRRFRAWEGERQGRTPLVALTAHASKGDREKCLAVGMDDYLAKPIKGKRLREAILRWVDPTQPPAAGPVPSAPSFDQGTLQELQEELGEDFSLVVDTFLSLLPQRLEEIQQAHGAGDWELLSRLAHTLKGGSAQFGATDLAGLLLRLEKMAQEAQVVDFHGLMAEIQRQSRLMEAFLAGGSSGHPGLDAS